MHKEPRVPLNSTRSAAWGIVLWTAGILLALGLAWFIGAVVVPVWQTHRVLKEFQADSDAKIAVLRWLASRSDGSSSKSEMAMVTAQTSISQLGGPEKAAGRLRTYLRLPRNIAPEKESAVWLLFSCGEAGKLGLAEAAQSPDANLRTLAARIIEARQTAPAAEDIPIGGSDR